MVFYSLGHQWSIFTTNHCWPIANWSGTWTRHRFQDQCCERNHGSPRPHYGLTRYERETWEDGGGQWFWRKSNNSRGFGKKNPTLALLKLFWLILPGGVGCISSTHEGCNSSDYDADNRRDARWACSFEFQHYESYSARVVINCFWLSSPGPCWTLCKHRPRQLFNCSWQDCTEVGWRGGLRTYQLIIYIRIWVLISALELVLSSNNTHILVNTL